MKIKEYKLCNDEQVLNLGQTPSEWSVLRIKDLVTRIGSGVTPKGGSEVYVESGIPLLRSQNVYDDGLRIEDVSFIDEETNKKMKGSQLKPFDILINITGASIGRTCVVPGNLKKANINQHIIFLRIKKRKVDFLSFYLKSPFIKDHIMMIQAGSSKEALNMGQLLNIPVLIPNQTEQNQMANFLDHKTTAIDKKISLLEQKIIYYQEFRKSLIDETVCRGLDKNVKLKDSGIEWVGMIPEHWDVKRTTDICKQNKRKNILLKETNLLSLSYGNIVIKDFETAFGLLPKSFDSYQIVEKGYIILRLTDLQNDKKSLRVGLVHEKGIITSAYLGLIFHKSIYSSFVFYLLHSYDIKKVFYSQGGSMRQSMKFDDFKSIKIIIPPKQEQRQIAKYLDDKTSKTDQIISNIQNQIEALKELRKTLINDVVTGKIKVTEP